MKYFALAFLAMSIGCAHSQVTPTPHSVALAWSVPANPVNPPAGAWTGCGTPSTCTFVVSRASGNTCPAFAYNPTAGGSGNYTPLNQSTPATGTAYTDSAAAGSVCYLVQTLQAGEYSGASNLVGPFIVPANPASPIVNSNATVAKADPEAINDKLAAPILTAKLTPVR